MKGQERSQEIFGELQDAVVGFDSNLVRQAARHALSGGVDALDAITNGLAMGIERVGELYARGEYFLPELSMCADTFYDGLAILRPHVKWDSARSAKGTVVIGTIEGDRHDIGKNVVKLLLEAAGLEVCDLGADVSPERIVREAARTRAALVCLSVTLTTALPILPCIVDMLRMSSPGVGIVVGGGAVSDQDARRWGVDGYAADALSLWRVMMQLMDSPLPQNQTLEAASRSNSRQNSQLAEKEPPVSPNLFQAISNQQYPKEDLHVSPILATVASRPRTPTAR